jgi:hypothetical protein
MRVSFQTSHYVLNFREFNKKIQKTTKKETIKLLNILEPQKDLAMLININI